MAATIAGALKQLIEAAGLGVAAYRGKAPTDAALPYVVIRERLDISPEESFNAYDDPEGHVREDVQLDLWQAYRAQNGAIAESPTLPDALARALHGKRLASAPVHVSGMRVLSGPVRLPIEEDANRVHDVITLEIARVLQPRA
jgi:hypothetical protein